MLLFYFLLNPPHTHTHTYAQRSYFYPESQMHIFHLPHTNCSALKLYTMHKVNYLESAQPSIHTIQIHTLQNHLIYKHCKNIHLNVIY